MWHDVTRKALTEAAIEKRSFEPITAAHKDLFVGNVSFACAVEIQESLNERPTILNVPPVCILELGSA